MPKAYPKAPIVEAALEVRYGVTIPDDLVEKAHRRLVDEYKKSEELTEVVVTIATGDQPPPPPPRRPKMFRLTTEDGSAIAMLSSNNVILSRLAPYADWSDFEARARRLWGHWTKAVGRKPIARLGLRYINRIDIPLSDGTVIQPEDWISARYEAPPVFLRGIGAMNGFMGGKLDEEYDARIGTALTDSPILRHLGLALDIDVSRQLATPTTDNDMWRMFNEMRDRKNAIFEACITDRTRALFE